MSPYDDLPDDNYDAFLHLEAVFRRDFEDNFQRPNGNWEYLATDYMNKTLAAAREL